MSTFMDKMKALAKGDKKTIVLAEGEERRTVQAADAVLREGFANVILLGNEAKIKELSADLNLSGARIIDPATSDLTADFEDTPEFEWLYAHCADYGFILRYPRGKENVTGVTYEPWHYRYVGKDAAKAIMQAGGTLEEYTGAHTA